MNYTYIPIYLQKKYMTIVVCTAPSATKKGYLYWATELVRGKNQAAKGDGVTSTNIKCPAAPAGGCAEDGKILGGLRGTVRVATNYFSRISLFDPFWLLIRMPKRDFRC